MKEFLRKLTVIISFIIIFIAVLPIFFIVDLIRFIIIDLGYCCYAIYQLILKRPYESWNEFVYKTWSNQSLTIFLFDEIF